MVSIPTSNKPNSPRLVGNSAKHCNAPMQHRTPTAAVEATLEPVLGPRVAKTVRLLVRLAIVVAALYGSVAFMPGLSTPSMPPSQGTN